MEPTGIEVCASTPIYSQSAPSTLLGEDMVVRIVSPHGITADLVAMVVSLRGTPEDRVKATVLAEDDKSTHMRVRILMGTESKRLAAKLVDRLKRVIVTDDDHLDIGYIYTLSPLVPPRTRVSEQQAAL